MRQAVDEPDGSHLREKGADERDELAGEIEAEVAMPQRAEELGERSCALLGFIEERRG